MFGLFPLQRTFKGPPTTPRSIIFSPVSIAFKARGETHKKNIVEKKKLLPCERVCQSLCPPLPIWAPPRLIFYGDVIGARIVEVAPQCLPCRIMSLKEAGLPNSCVIARSIPRTVKYRACTHIRISTHPLLLQRLKGKQKRCEASIPDFRAHLANRDTPSCQPLPRGVYLFYDRCIRKVYTFFI